MWPRSDLHRGRLLPFLNGEPPINSRQFGQMNHRGDESRSWNNIVTAVAKN